MCTWVGGAEVRVLRRFTETRLSTSSVLFIPSLSPIVAPPQDADDPLTKFNLSLSPRVSSYTPTRDLCGNKLLLRYVVKGKILGEFGQLVY